MDHPIKEKRPVIDSGRDVTQRSTVDARLAASWPERWAEGGQAGNVGQTLPPLLPSPPRLLPAWPAYLPSHTVSFFAASLCLLVWAWGSSFPSRTP